MYSPTKSCLLVRRSLYQSSRRLSVGPRLFLFYPYTFINYGVKFVAVACAFGNSDILLNRMILEATLV